MIAIVAARRTDADCDRTRPCRDRCSQTAAALPPLPPPLITHTTRSRRASEWVLEWYYDQRLLPLIILLLSTAANEDDVWYFLTLFTSSLIFPYRLSLFACVCVWLWEHEEVVFCLCFAATLSAPLVGSRIFAAGLQRCLDVLFSVSRSLLLAEQV